MQYKNYHGIRATFFLLAITLMSSCLIYTRASTRQESQQASRPTMPENIAPAELHGGIEISPRVIRSIALRISSASETNNVKVLYSYTTVLTAPSYIKDGKLTEEYIRDTSLAVQKVFQQLQQQNRIPANQIHILGLSDFTAVNTGELRDEILEKTGRQVDFVNADSETELSIAGTIPRRYKVGAKTFDNRSVSMLLDISNTGIRGGYQQIKSRTQGAPEYEFVTWNIPKGSSTFAAEVSRAVVETADLPAFAKRAQALSSTALTPLIAAETAKRPAMLSRKKVYLTGGIVWAMMTLLHPEDQSNYAPITMDDINTFYNRAVLDPESLMNPDLSRIQDEANRNEMRRARDTVKQAYSPKTLIAGAEMLRVLATEMQFQNRSVIYPRYAWLARVLSYVRVQQQE